MIRRIRRSPEGGRLSQSLRTTRMDAFSDGVFAIAITLLVLEISLPEDKAIGEGVLHLWPSYVAYLTSFLTIGGVWLSHTVISEYLARVDSVFLRLNLALLMVVSFLPFPTRLIAETMDDTEDARVAAPLYGFVLLALVVLLAAMWRYAVRAGLLRSDADDDDVRVTSKRFTPRIALYAVAIAVGFVLPRAGSLLYMAIAIYVLVPAASDGGVDDVPPEPAAT